MLTYLEAAALAMAAGLNTVLAYESGGNRCKTAVLAGCAAVLALMAVHMLWPFY